MTPLGLDVRLDLKPPLVCKDCGQPLIGSDYVQSIEGKFCRRCGQVRAAEDDAETQKAVASCRCERDGYSAACAISDHRYRAGLDRLERERMRGGRRYAARGTYRRQPGLDRRR